MLVTMQELRQRAEQEMERLRALEQQTFRAGEPAMMGPPGLPVLIQPERYPGRADLHMIALGVHPPVAPVLRRLPCGVLDASGNLRAAARTSQNGVFSVDLPAGDYRLRLVDDVRDETDVRILEMINDARARSQIKIAFRGIAEPPALHRRLRLAWLAPWLRLMTSETSAVVRIDPRTPVESTFVLAAKSAEPVVGDEASGVDASTVTEGPPTPQLWTVDNGRAVDVECPADHMPLGLGCLVAIETETNNVVAAEIVAASRRASRPAVRRARLSIEALMVEGRTLDIKFAPASDDEDCLYVLAAFCDEIRQELERTRDDELRSGIGSLLERLEVLADADEDDGDMDDDVLEQAVPDVSATPRTNRPTAPLDASPLDVSLVCDLAAALDTPSPTSRQDRLGENQGTDPWIDQGLFHFACPAEKAAFEFGVVLIAWCDEQNVCVETNLLPVHLFTEDNRQYYFNVVPLDEVLSPQQDRSRLRAEFFDDAERILRVATFEQVDAWIAEYGERWGDDWLRRIRELRKQLTSE